MGGTMEVFQVGPRFSVPVLAIAPQLCLTPAIWAAAFKEARAKARDKGKGAATPAENIFHDHHPPCAQLLPFLLLLVPRPSQPSRSAASSPSSLHIFALSFLPMVRR